jgi:sigma-B regulation protein RsbU (phosphoserine phosphatase)
MIYRGRPVGVVRVYMGTKHQFSQFEAALLRAIASQTAAAIVNARLHEEAMEADRYARQMQYAGQVQRRMIPKHPPDHPSVEFGCVYDPTLEVGGDFYDFIKLPEGHVGIAIADVVGKGVPASVMMASVRSALRVYAYNVYDINEILSHVNRHMCRDTLASEFATLFYGVLSPDGRSLTYCNAGHDPPLLLRDGAITKLEAGGLAIGVIRDEIYANDVVQLQPDDVILLYTDGVAEALNFADQTYGRRRLEESLIRHGLLHGSQIAQNVLWDVRRFVGLADQSDDITLVSMKIR